MNQPSLYDSEFDGVPTPDAGPPDPRLGYAGRQRLVVNSAAMLALAWVDALALAFAWHSNRFDAIVVAALAFALVPASALVFCRDCRRHARFRHWRWHACPAVRHRARRFSLGPSAQLAFWTVASAGIVVWSLR